MSNFVGLYLVDIAYKNSFDDNTFIRSLRSKFSQNKDKFNITPDGAKGRLNILLEFKIFLRIKLFSVQMKTKIEC